MDYIFGFQPVIEAIKCHPESIDVIFIAEHLATNKKRQLITLTKEKNIPLKVYPKEGLSRLLKNKRPIHQGVVARIKNFSYVELEEIKNASIILILDHIQDPQNLGNIIRSACAFGVKDIILPKNRAASITPAVVKASTGSVFRTRIVRVTNLAQTLDKLKSAGFWIIGTVARQGKPLWSLDIDTPLGIIIGHEHKGISKLLKEKCDFLVKIPISKEIDSLNAATAAAICLYEIFRKKYK